MRVSRLVAPVVSAIALFAAAPVAFGAAQLKAGATTSAQPTSTNPQVRTCQITFDPDVILDNGGSGATTQPSNPDYHVNAFQLSVKYDQTKVQLNDVLFIAPFTEIPPTTPALGPSPAASVPSTGTPGQFYFNNSEAGTVSYIAGMAESPASVPSGDVNIFAIDFTLLPGVSYDTPLTFTIYADENNGDFIQGTDPATGESITSLAPDITPTTITFSFNQMTAIVNASDTPLPKGALGGAVTLGLLGAAYGLSTRRHRLAA